MRTGSSLAFAHKAEESSLRNGAVILIRKVATLLPGPPTLLTDSAFFVTDHRIYAIVPVSDGACEPLEVIVVDVAARLAKLAAGFTSPICTHVPHRTARVCFWCTLTACFPSPAARNACALGATASAVITCEPRAGCEALWPKGVKIAARLPEFAAFFARAAADPDIADMPR